MIYSKMKRSPKTGICILERINRLALGMKLKISRLLLVYNQYRQPSTKKGTPFLRFPVSCCQAYIKANELSASKVPNAVTLTPVLSNVAIWLISRVLIILIRIPTCRAIAMTVVTL